MQMKPRKYLAAKTALILALTGTVLPPATQAGIPVIDGVNVVQNIMQVIEAIASTLKQIEEYQTQLQQYQNMLQNTLQPAQNIWDDAQRTMNSLRGAVDTLAFYKNQLGSVDNYIQKFSDLAGYRNSPCFSANGCSAAQWAAMNDSERLGSESQKRATDALFRGLDQQQDNLQADARTLSRLQSAAQGSSGELEAIGYANQLASAQSHQLLQIRGLLISEQNVVATRNQALVDREAKERASAESVRRGNFVRSPAATY